MTLAAGTKLGPYEILSPIGAGGMGEVYKARDTRLRRDVAVKVLPEGFAQNADRMNRFEREARILAALNHPNVLSVFDVGTHEGTPYVVTELLEGQSLRQIMSGAPLSVHRAVETGSQIAKGLAAAHDKGVVHRDLKPGNVFVTREGHVKVLDFGLAKMEMPASPPEPGLSKESTAEMPTGPGVILGTVGYMAPEQVRGEPGDARSDIFAFGAVLYEMLSGKRPFERGSAAETMTAILKEDPPELTRTDTLLPPALVRVVNHCLEKSPEARFQSAKDMAFDLETLSGLSSASLAGKVEAQKKGFLGFRTLIAGALVAVALLSATFSLAYLLGWRARKPAEPVFRRVTFRAGCPATARFTPDLQSVVYSAFWEGGRPYELFVQRLASADARPLGVSGMIAGVTGADVIYLHDGTLSRIPLEGGIPRELLSGLTYADCDRTGAQFAIVRRRPAGEDRDVVEQLEYPVGKVLLEARGTEGVRNIRLSPDGQRLAFIWQSNRNALPADVCVVDAAGQKKTLAKNWPNAGFLAWSPDGTEVWFMAAQSEINLELHAVTLSGKERLVARFPGRMRLRDVSSDGRMLATFGQRRFELRGRLAGDTTERDHSWLDGTFMPVLSPDGTQMVFQEWGDAGGMSATAYHWRSGDPTPKRLGKGTPWSVSPDWTTVLIGGDDHVEPKLMPMGAGETVTLPRGPIKSYVWGYWHPDGRRAVFLGAGVDGKMRLFVQDVRGGVPRPLAEASVLLTFSPDGRFVVARPRAGQPCAYFPVDGGGPQPIPFLQAGETPRAFTEDGKSLYVASLSGECVYKVVRLDLQTGKRTPWLELTPPDQAGAFAGNPVCERKVWITPDGRYYLYGYTRYLQDLYLIEGMK